MSYQMWPILAFLSLSGAMIAGYYWIRGFLPRWTVLMIPFALFAIGVIHHMFSEYVFNKGPNDSGAQLAASVTLLNGRQGAQWPVSLKLVDYQRDPSSAGSGTYDFSYQIGGERGKILCHYDTSIHKFDHDEIVPDN
jgi:hypothetical protein